MDWSRGNSPTIGGCLLIPVSSLELFQFGGNSRECSDGDATKAKCCEMRLKGRREMSLRGEGGYGETHVVTGIRQLFAIAFVFLVRLVEVLR
jgi:hypothetical protein